MRHGGMRHYIPSSLILSRTWLTKPRVVRLTAKGFNSGLLIIRDDQGYELMVHEVVDVKLQRGEQKFPHAAVIHDVDHMQRLGIFTVGEDISQICKWGGGKCLPGRARGPKLAVALAGAPSGQPNPAVAILAGPLGVGYCNHEIARAIRKATPAATPPLSTV
jgi:hypothetical protein